MSPLNLFPLCKQAEGQNECGVYGSQGFFRLKLNSKTSSIRAPHFLQEQITPCSGGPHRCIRPVSGDAHGSKVNLTAMSVDVEDSVHQLRF